MKKLIVLLAAFAILSTGAGAVYDPQVAEEEAAMDAASIETSVFSGEAAEADLIDVAAPAAILIEKTTGTVLYEKNADERMLPASVTKVMSILLIAEAVESGVISLDDAVSVSAYAAGMGGSQVYLEAGEQMTVRELLKCIVVVSANDATVAMAEYLAGTEETFVGRMNERAAELGMTNTVFTNSTGLWDDGSHVTSARDIAIMSRELIQHEWIKEYTTIWMDTIRDGAFGLSNTNKLIYYYDGSTGLKTGFTRDAGYCLSATAEKEGVEYIAVVLGCKTSEERFESTKAMLNFAFANFTLYQAVPDEVIKPVHVKLGRTEYIQPQIQGMDRILVRKSMTGSLRCVTEMAEEVTAPVEAGTQVGRLVVSDGENQLMEIPLVTAGPVERLTLWDIWKTALAAVWAVS